VLNTIPKNKAQNSTHSRSKWDDVWLVIPAYNEATTIRELAQQALELCPRVIIVDDHSSDHTIAKLDGLEVVLLKNEINRGKAACLLSAFTYAEEHRARCVITLDGDGQHNPYDAEKLLSAWLHQPSQIIIGARLHDKNHFPFARYYANCVARFWISWAAAHPIADSQTGFRVYPIEALRIALQGNVTGTRFTFESELLIEAALAGITTVAVKIPVHYPTNARPSHFRPVVDIVKIILMVARKLLRQGMAPRGLINSLKSYDMFYDDKTPPHIHK